MQNGTGPGWGIVSRLLHWGMAGMILFMSGLGLYMTNAFPPGDMASYPWYQMHKSWGFAVFALALLRVLWRLAGPARPPLPTAMPGWERTLSGLSHGALYLLILALPVSGWLMVSASPLQDLGVPNKVFGLFDFPDPFVPGTSALSDMFRAWHETLWWALTAVVGLHVLAALKHHFVTGDSVLRAMIRG